MKKLLMGAALLLGTVASAESLLINGAGATFPFPIYSKWFNEYNKLHPELKFNYQSIGSGGGIKQFTDGTVDFGASDAPMKDDQIAKVPDVVHIPTVLGADVVAYNAPGMKTLRFSPETLANIFLGKITKWNDPAILADNPGVKLPDQSISVAHRSDGSGTTYIFTDYLSKISPEWKSKVGSGTSVNWPVGLGGKGNEGVTGLVKSTPGSIGYVELIYAIQQKLSVADIKNSSGNFITPKLETATAAADGAAIPDDYRVSITNPPGAQAYPISGFTWLLVHKDAKDKAKGTALVNFLRWALTDGQKLATPLDYAPLPATLQQRVLKTIDTLTVNGTKISADRGTVAETVAPAALNDAEGAGRALGNVGDRVFGGVLWILGIMVLVVAGLIILNLALVARPLAKEHSLWGFITDIRWDPVEDRFGALSFLYGTLVTAAVSIIVAVPIAIGLALFITQFAPPKLGRVLTMPVELLAAIPSVVYGLWGLFVVVPWLRDPVEPWLGKFFGWIPLFQGPPIGLGYLASGLILAVMILPTIVAVSVEVMKTTPEANREAALALGATKWEAVMMAVIPYSRAGILGAVLLGLGRALGETMAVTMVIGNSPQISASLFAPGYSLPAVIANEFAEAVTNVHIAALAGLGLILFATTFLLNAGARILVTAVQKGPGRIQG